MGGAGESSTGPGNRISVTEALKEPDGDRWKELGAEEVPGLWEKVTFSGLFLLKVRCW